MTNEDDLVQELLSRAATIRLDPEWSREPPGQHTPALLEQAAGTITLLRSQTMVHLTWSSIPGQRAEEMQLELGAGIVVGWVQMLGPNKSKRHRPHLSLPGLLVRHPEADCTTLAEAQEKMEGWVLAWMQRAATGPGSAAVPEALADRSSPSQRP